MSGTYDRGRALLDVTSPLGPGALYITGLSARECISQPFDFQLTLLSEQATIDPNAVLNKPMSVVLRHDARPVRYFHGITQHFSADGTVTDRGLTVYRARLVPQLWFLSQTEDCRIFQKETMRQIVEKILREGSVKNVSFDLRSPQPEREYTTQFNESDLDFVSRLLQEDGAFYYFRHTQNDHSLVITDHNGTYGALPSSPLRFDSVSADDSVLTGWHRPHATAHGNMRMSDYDPTQPTATLSVTRNTVLSTAGAAARDVFRWPARSYDSGRITAMTRFRLEAAEASVSTMHGTGRCRDMSPGQYFILSKDPITDEADKGYVIQSVTHEAWDQTMLAGDGGTSYENKFTAFRDNLPWREPFSIPRPRMEGVHSALVIGPPSTEIHTDDLGRVKVRFFWEHRAEAHPDRAVWARVIYPWAGNGWGWQSTPRVGTEVAVAFMDGDPDRPVVLGGMYNGVDKPIYPKAEATKSGIRTRSSLKGGTSNFNELTFDDKKGSELIYVQAEKNMQTLVKNDQTLTVNHNRIKTIKHNETTKIGNDLTETIQKGNRTVKIEKGSDSLEVVLGNIAIKAVAGKIDITAMQSITLTVGDSSVKIDPAGVTIKGMTLKHEAGLMLDTKAPMTMMKTDGMMIVKAGLMLLN